MNYLLTFTACLLAFLIGSIPFGYVFAKMKGVDITTLGSGNIGATNVKRILGKKAGALTLIADITKGALCPALTFLTLGNDHILFASVLGFCAILGHCYSPFLKGKGGKGVATSFGAFLSISPSAAIISLIVFVVVLKCFRYVALASITASYSLPFSLYILNQGTTLLLLGLLTAALISLRHKENIIRIKQGSEPKAFSNN